MGFYFISNWLLMLLIQVFRPLDRPRFIVPKIIPAKGIQVFGCYEVRLQELEVVYRRRSRPVLIKKLRPQTKGSKFLIFFTDAVAGNHASSYPSAKTSTTSQGFSGQIRLRACIRLKIKLDQGAPHRDRDRPPPIPIPATPEARSRSPPSKGQPKSIKSSSN